jgi:hypothetical protein
MKSDSYDGNEKQNQHVQCAIVERNQFEEKKYHTHTNHTKKKDEYRLVVVSRE